MNSVPASQEVIVRIAMIIMSLLFGLERFKFALTSLQSGKTRRKRPVGKKYSSDPDDRGIDIYRDENPLQFWFFIGLWFALSVLMLGGSFALILSFFIQRS